MLSSPRRRPLPLRQQSLRQEYEEFVLQRIEEYKEQLSRTELLSIADEAVRELEVSAEEQLVLTEVLVLEHVDRLIMRRLRLPTFRRWRERHLELRKSQQSPEHWNLDPATPLVDLAQRLDESDMALIVGGGAAAAGFYLAAHGWPALLIDQELRAVEAVEARAAAEGLRSRIQALVVSMANWFPDVTPTLTVIEPKAVSRLEPQVRTRAMDSFKSQTSSRGVHFVLPADREEGVIALAAEKLQEHYADWWVQRTRSDHANWGFLAIKP